MRRAILTALFAVAALAATTGPASAYVISGNRWPEGSILYYTNVGSQNDEVVRAASAWNKEKLGVKFVRTKSKSSAQLIIRYGSRGCGGLGTVGYYGERFVGDVQLGRACRDAITRLTAAHELGHVLGLGHEESRCALMNPVGDISTGTPNHCSVRPIRYWLKNPIQADDRRGGRKLYADSLGSSASVGSPGPVLTLP
jgi:Astacin (Peptidase family M12A)